jgi:outer membrane protein assembly factor BamB
MQRASLRRLTISLALQLACGFAFSSPSLRADDSWPQFRGPTGQGVAVAANLPLTWSETENVRWKTVIPGEGWSSPVVLDGQIWLTSATEEGRSLRAICVDLASGKVTIDREVFRIEKPEHVNAKNSHASPTPIVEPGRVYVHFGTNGTACLDSKTGNTLWSTQQYRLEHKEGPGSSPVMYQDRLILNCDGMDVQCVVALDKMTGKLAWRTDRPNLEEFKPDMRKAYATPLVIRHDGRDQLVSPGAQRVISYDPATGQALWQVDFKGFSNVARPVFDGSVVYVNTGYGKSQLWAIRPDSRGNVSESHVTWKATKAVTLNPSPLVVDGLIYMIDDKGIASCLDSTTGDAVWTERLGGNFTSSPVFADGRIYVTGDNGKTYVLAAGREFKVLAENTLDGRVQASPAIVGRAVVLRSQTHLYRIEKP